MTMEKWEYHIEKFTYQSGAPGAQAIGIVKPTNVYDVVQKRLNELGLEGWELVQVAPPLPGVVCGNEPLMLYYFKRPKT